jgi:hypothetical protein
VIVPVSSDNQDVVLDLLCEGFDRPRSFWLDGLARVGQLGDNVASRVPLGYVLSGKDRPVGVVLTLASQSVMACRPALVINLSSWYVQRAHRWRAPAMLRAVLKAHDAVFTDLTPSEEVRKLNATVGFKPINSGQVITALPILTVTASRGATVRDFDAHDVSAVSPEVASLLRRHQEIGCLPALLETRTGCHPLMFRRRTIRGVSAVQLVFCDSNAALVDNLTAVARYLLAKGVAVMIGDDTGQRLRLGQVRRRGGLKFARAPAGTSIAPDRIDYSSSELCCFDF